MSRALCSCISSSIQIYAMQYVSTSVTLLILENPFVPGILAYLIVGEQITNKEWIVFTIATTGLALLSLKHSKSKEEGMESIGIALVCVASAVQSLGIISLRKMKSLGMYIDNVAMIVFITIVSLVLNSSCLLV